MDDSAWFVKKPQWNPGSVKEEGQKVRSEGEGTGENAKGNK